MANAFVLPNTGVPSNVLVAPVDCGNPKEIAGLGVGFGLSVELCETDEFPVVVAIAVGLATAGNVNDGVVAEKQNPPRRGTESLDVLVV